MTGIISAIIAGAVTLIGVLIANGKSQAVTDTKLEELTREVREHNNFARRVPILEEQMKVANHRIADLEKERKNDWSRKNGPYRNGKSCSNFITAAPNLL